ncbi:MAG: ATP-dependent DNA helicase RecG [Candidatus Izemoplasmatales bacterium]
MELKDVSEIGKVTLEKLNKYNINSVDDLLFSFPTKYQINSLDSREDIVLDKTLTLKVEVINKPKLYYIRKKLTKLSINVLIGNLKFIVVIFNREFLSGSIHPANKIVITGKFLKNFNTFSASNIVLFDNFKEGIIPIYNIKDISEHRIRTSIRNILNESYKLTDILPEYIISKHGFKNINQIIKIIHIPEKITDVIEAKRRMAYEEFLLFAIRVEAIKKLNQRLITPVKHYDIEQVRRFIASLPFELTDDQKNVTNEIFKDFKKNTRMNRLLQGDVGSGKTIISIISSLAVVSAKYQVAVLAPTLVLAKQHLNTFTSYLNSFGLRIELLTSEIIGQKRDMLLEDIKKSEIDIVIGTHSLLQEGVIFNNLGFVVIDEQQRFGVEQRKIIREKGVYPDVLMMSATPIPRTLAISIFENTDVSVIKQKPSNRKLIKTEIIDFENIESAFKTIDKELTKNRQVYVICPLIESVENKNQISIDEAERIISRRFKTAKTTILHGKMSDQEKTDIIMKFGANQINILISTTVVEVGVNIENASTMIILNANVFGLAQLHQLRGRIGRNDYDAYCYLVVDDYVKEKDRLDVLEKTNDGFKISEHDLLLRGPGEVFGFAQSGIPNFRYANLISDEVLRKLAFDDAKTVITTSDIVSKKLVNKVLKTIESYNLD